MTTATRRLRRTGVAGFAASVTAGVAIFATATSAVAALGTLSDRIDPTNGITTVFPGTTAAAVGDLDLNLTNAFNIGDTILVQLTKTPGCGTTNGAVGFSSAPTVTASGPTIGTYGTGGASADAASTVKPTFSSALQSSAGACTVAGVKDQLLITLTNSATGAPADNFEIILSGQKVNVGSAVTAGSITETPNAATAIPVATVGVNSVTVDKVVGATNGAAGVALGTITATDVTGGSLSGSIQFKLATAADAFATKGTLTAPAGVTVTGPAVTEVLPSNTLTYTIAGTVPAGGKFVLSGTTVNLSNTAVSHKVLVTTGAASPPVVVVGPAGGVEVAVTAAEARIAGVDRYGTARALYTSQFAGAASAVVTSGVNFPDALSAEALAKNKSTGVLLTDPNSLSQDTQQELMADTVTTVYIVGGTAAVSAAVAAQIAAIHVHNVPTAAFINVVRIAGADRYATNNAVDLTVGGTKAIVATGTNFADALASGPVIYAEGGPAGYVLILTDPTSLNPNASSTLTNLGITHVIIAGGTSAVSAGVETSLKNSGVTTDYRIAGADRTATAALIATWATAGLPASGTYAALAALPAAWAAGAATAYLTNGANFPDALASGPVGGNLHHVLLLTSSPSTLGTGAATYLGGKAGAITAITALGFSAAVAPATLNDAVAALG